MDPQSVKTILTRITEDGWSADNLAFGSGGALLQKVNRDTQKFAIKCSQALVGDEWRDVIKDPITDPGKKSKAGRLKLVLKDGKYETVRFHEKDPDLRYLGDDQMRLVFRDGDLVRDEKFSDIRERAAQGAYRSRD